MSQDSDNESPIAAIAAAIEPADAANRERAYRLLGARPEQPADTLVALAARLAGARHTVTPKLREKYVVICAADHGIAGATGASPAARALGEIASGRAAVNSVARSAAASVLVVDCGSVHNTASQATDPDPARPAGVMDMRLGNGTADIRHAPAMTRAAAEASVHTGVALALSLVDGGADCLALGQVAPGAHIVSEALCAVLLALPGRLLDPDARATIADIRARHDLDGVGERDPLAALTAIGGYEIGVMTGIILAAASVHVPVVLDDRGTSAAALLAARLSPHVPDYLIASHAGHSLGHQQALHDLRQPMLFDLGVSHGEGTGAALALPLLDSAARLLREHGSR